MTIIAINSRKLTQLLKELGKEELMDDPEVMGWITKESMPSTMVKSICTKAGLEAYPNLDSVFRPVWSFRKKEWPEREPDIYLREVYQGLKAC